MSNHINHMLTDQERIIEKLVVDRFRERRSEKINTKMVQEGSLWFDNFITNNYYLDYFATSIPWIKFGTGVSNFKDLSNENYQVIKGVGLVK